MAFGFPPSCSDQIKLPPHECDDVREWLLTLIDSLGWSIIDVSHNSVTASTGASIRSYGEVVIFEVESTGAVKATSRNTFPFQVCDWGKNKKNIERIHTRVARLNSGLRRE